LHELKISKKSNEEISENIATFIKKIAEIEKPKNK